MRAFFLIFLAGLGCGILGAGGGWLIARLSPTFIALVARPIPVTEPESLGVVLGLLSGLLLGTGAMTFGLLIDALRLWALRPRSTPDPVPGPATVPEQPGGRTPEATTRFRPESRSRS